MLTTERKEEIKGCIDILHNTEQYSMNEFHNAADIMDERKVEWIVELLAALEESQQQNVTLKEELEDKINESNEFYKWWQEEVSQRNIYKHELAEAQQTIARYKSALEDIVEPRSPWTLTACLHHARVALSVEEGETQP